MKPDIQFDPILTPTRILILQLTIDSIHFLPPTQYYSFLFTTNHLHANSQKRADSSFHSLQCTKEPIHFISIFTTPLNCLQCYSQQSLSISDETQFYTVLFTIPLNSLSFFNHTMHTPLPNLTLFCRTGTIVQTKIETKCYPRNAWR